MAPLSTVQAVISDGLVFLAIIANGSLASGTAAGALFGTSDIASPDVAMLRQARI